MAKPLGEFLGVDNLDDENFIKLLNRLNINFGVNGKPVKKVSNSGESMVVGETPVIN